jgi:hypothetical protein
MLTGELEEAGFTNVTWEMFDYQMEVLRCSTLSSPQLFPVLVLFTFARTHKGGKLMLEFCVPARILFTGKLSRDVTSI